jgi:hypothetical protein
MRPTHLIPPFVNHDDPDHPFLLPVILRARLTCYEPVDPKFMGSELVVVWFREDCHLEPIEQIVFDGVRELPWEQLAGNFDW